MIWTGLVAWLAVIDFFLNTLFYGQPSAVLWKDQLFTEITDYAPPGKLYRGTFTPAVKQVRSPLEYYNLPIWFTASPQAKLHIRGDRVMLCSGGGGYYIFPIGDVPLLEIGDFGYKLREIREGPGSDEFFQMHRFPNLPPDFGRFTRLVDPCSAMYLNLVFPNHRTPDIPLSETARDDGDKPSSETYWKTARHDVLIAGSKSVWLFHAYKDKLFVSVERDWLFGWCWDDDTHEPKKNLPKPPERQLRTGKLPANFTEPFAAYMSGSRGYLVTPSGKVYMAAPKGKAEVEVSTIWNDPKHKIVGVVQDPANDAVYGWGFVTNRIEPERFYVKFAAEPVVVSYKLTAPLWNDRSDAYLESYECARAFRKAAEKK